MVKQENLVAAYSSNEEAWFDISKHAPCSSIVLMHGILLFKNPAGQWEPYVATTLDVAYLMLFYFGLVF